MSQSLSQLSASTDLQWEVPATTTTESWGWGSRWRCRWIWINGRRIRRCW